MSFPTLFALATSVVLVAARPALAQTDERSDAVRATAERLLAAISARDTTTLRRLLLPNAPVIAMRQQGDSVVRRTRTAEETIAGLGAGGPVLLERMWDPEVRVSGSIATVWTPYDFYVDGTFSHCGIDAFQLVDTPDGWRVASIIYTVVPGRERCPPSPLGDP